MREHKGSDVLTSLMESSSWSDSSAHVPNYKMCRSVSQKFHSRNFFWVSRTQDVCLQPGVHGWTLHCVHYQLWPPGELQPPLPPQETLQDQQEIIKLINIKNQHPKCQQHKDLKLFYYRCYPFQGTSPNSLADLKELWIPNEPLWRTLVFGRTSSWVLGSTGKPA